LTAEYDRDDPNLTKRMQFMSVITISSGPYCRREEIAEKTARTLGYECIGQEVLEIASDRYGTARPKLAKAMEDASSIFSSAPNTRARLLAYYQAAFLSELTRDNIVYQGRSGHLFINGVSHVLKVRVLASLEDRIRLKMDLENLTDKKARSALLREAKARQKWSQAAFKVDESDPSLFDLVINISQIDPDRAVELIVDTVRDVKFQPMTYSVKCMQDAELAGRVRAALIESYPDIKVQARDGNIYVRVTGVTRKDREKKGLLIKEQIMTMEGVNYVEARVDMNILSMKAARG